MSIMVATGKGATMGVLFENSADNFCQSVNALAEIGLHDGRHEPQ